MKRLCMVVVPVFGIMLFQGCCGGSYSCQLEKSLKENFGRDLKAYTFRSTPVGNFGVGSIYDADIDEGKKPEDTWLLGSVSSWFKDDISEAEKAEALKMIIEDGDYGTVEVTKEISNTLGLDTVIPNIHSLLDVGAGVNLTKGVDVTLSATKATNRKLNWTNFVRVLNEGLLNDETKAYIARDDIAMGAADIILEGYSAEVNVDSSVNANLNAGLSDLANTVVGNDSELSVRVERMEQGTFKISSEEPVVAAVLYLKPPRGHAIRSRGTDEIIFSRTIEDWQPILLPKRAMNLQADMK